MKDPQQEKETRGDATGYVIYDIVNYKIEE